MRILLIAMIAAIGACASGARAPAPEGPSPFPVARGEVPPPPAGVPGQSAPPQGVGPGGVDFGPWRSADPASYTPAFQNQMRARQAGRAPAQIRTDLAANGFACEEGQRLECRIEIMERQCAFDWYVVAENAELIAGFDIMCLGAR